MSWASLAVSLIVLLGAIGENASAGPPGRPTPTNPLPKVEAITRTSTQGKASWYCKAGVSICHYRYPPGSMVAAACHDLRKTMGKNWRGKTVTVTRLDNGRNVRVKLVDYCASKDKLIDLYWEPMNLLGGTGVLKVAVAW